MQYPRNFLIKLVSLAFTFWLPIASADTPVRVPILTYHNFDPSKPGSMTISTKKFEAQLEYLKTNGYTVIPLQSLVNYLQGKGEAPPAKSVVITADDGRESVYTVMQPLVKKFHIPVTLFIYPIVISHAKYALTWAQIKDLQNTGLFTVEDHTYWHPNFKQDKKHMSETAYQKMVHVQLVNSKEVIEKKLGTHITLLAWPYGIYNPYLENEAHKAGYTMAFSIDDRLADKSEKAMAMPRYMIVEGQSMKTFAAIVSGHMQPKKMH